MANTKPLLKHDSASPTVSIMSASQSNAAIGSPSIRSEVKSRPVSMYDNLRVSGSPGVVIKTDMTEEGCHLPRNGGDMNANTSASEQNISIGEVIGKKKTNFSNVPDVCGDCDKCSIDRSPSQAIYLTTTVPQNMAARDIAGRHAPTRQSLRHSRMIVMSREGKVPRKYLPPLVRPYRVALTLACMELASGIALSLLALWLLMWAPNADPRHNPYWSGLTLALSGGLSPLMLSCCRKEYPGSNEYCVTAFKIICILTSALATVLCFVACLYAVLHLSSLSDMTCEPGNLLNTTCMCRPSEPMIVHELKAEARTQLNLDDKKQPVIQNLTDPDSKNEMIVYWYHYKDLNCQEVQGPWIALMYLSAFLNGAGVVVCSVFLYLFWSSRKEYKYAKVKTRDNQNIVIHQADS